MDMSTFFLPRNGTRDPGPGMFESNVHFSAHFEVYHLEHLLAPGDVIVQRTNRREFHQRLTRSLRAVKVEVVW